MSAKQKMLPIGQEVRLVGHRSCGVGVVKAVVAATKAHPVSARVLWPYLALAWELMSNLEVAS
jgi:hypothetical protein